MPKITLDMNTFKALASDSRLDILRALDGKKLNLKDICKATNLNKATLHEHLDKLNDAGLVKKNEREGHKWVYYGLTWKGEGLLHPENNRIVVLFAFTFISLFVGIIHLVNYAKGFIAGKAVVGSGSTAIYAAENSGNYLVQETFLKFSNAPIANVNLSNQTNDQLSQILINNIHLKGILGNSISFRSLAWESENAKSFVVCDAEKAGSPILTSGNGGTLSAPQSMIAIVHDPALQYIAIACVVIFSILLCVGIWRFWKNKQSKL